MGSRMSDFVVFYTLPNSEEVHELQVSAIYEHEAQNRAHRILKERYEEFEIVNTMYVSSWEED